jgi:prepilin-type N-terminal cleavage/methylation domain-containing protein
MRIKAKQKDSSGLTLVELLAVVSILGVLAAVVVSRVTASSKDANRNACYVNIGDIEMQVQLFRRNEGSWPANDLSDMIPPGETEYFPQGLPSCPYDGSAYTIDASTHRVQGHNHGP